MSQPAAQSSQATDQAGQDLHDGSISRIKALLESKDDTQRFVGLALLKSVLDNSPELRRNEEAIQGLWASVSPKFLDRLLKTGSQSTGKNVKEMLAIAVSVVHTFAALLPESEKSKAKFTDRIPRLSHAVLYSSGETTVLLLQLLRTLVNSPEGAVAFLQVEDVSALAESAPGHAAVLDIFFVAWITGTTCAIEKEIVANRIASGLQLLVSAFAGTDGSTLLDFLGNLLRSVEPTFLPREPKWLKAVVSLIRNLAASRPNATARSAYTTAAASVLQAYPSLAPGTLFSEDSADGKPFAYLLISLMLIDIKSTASTILEKLNQASYPQIARRIASAFDVVAFFIGYLVRCLEDESIETFPMSPDSLLKLRKAISETMSVVMELLRDRWDATFAGAMGLHPDARATKTETVTGSHDTLTWDSMVSSADEDPLTLSAIRALALWLREDDNETLQKEATGLTDMFVDLYRNSSSTDLDFRSAILVGFEALLARESGRDLFLSNGGWAVLTKDLSGLLQQSSKALGDTDASRGIEIVRVLLALVENEPAGTREEWMDFITTVAAWDFDCSNYSQNLEEFRVAILQLSCTLLAGASMGMRNRYKESIIAIRGIASSFGSSEIKDQQLRAAMDDVTNTLNGLDIRT